MIEPNAKFRNRILDRLPPREREQLVPKLEAIDYEQRDLLYDPLVPIPYAHFVENGIISILSVIGDGSAVETATIGCEGMIGLPLFHGLEFGVEQAMVQAPGHGFRMSAADFVALQPQLPTFTHLLHRFAAYCFTFAAQNSGCNRKHAVEQRCARWLMIVHDRMEGDELRLTHDFISQMLGVRRASVTETLQVFEDRKYIRSRRGRILVLDRDGLGSAACECYRIISSARDRMLEDLPSPSPLEGVATSRDGQSIVGDGTPIDAVEG